MQTEYIPDMDRTGWAPGPWDDEPDKAQWTDQATGLPCLAVRNELSVWCGYVGVPPEHPYHGRHFEGTHLAAHGEVNYAAPCQGYICHSPEPGQPENVWWFGFDCGHEHAGDVVPKWATGPADLSYRGPECARETRLWGYDIGYRDLEYVQTECGWLARQLAEGAR
jgi:hypothetical protein